MSKPSKAEEAFIQATAGAIAGAFSSAVLYPLDSVKTRVQANETKSSAVLAATWEIITEKGILPLYQGINTKTIETASKNFFYFYCYDFLINSVKATGAKITPSTTMVLGYLSGLVNTIVSSPLEVLGVRQQAAADGSRSVFSEAIDLWNKNGIAGFYKGFLFNVILCINPAIQNTVFDYLKIWYQSVIRKRKDFAKDRLVKLSPFQAFFFGALAKLVATLVTYPLIAKKTRIQVDATEKPNDSFLAKHYRGLSGQALKTILQAALMYMAKDQIASNTHLLISWIARHMQREPRGGKKLRSLRGHSIR